MEVDIYITISTGKGCFTDMNTRESRELVVIATPLATTVGKKTMGTIFLSPSQEDALVVSIKKEIKLKNVQPLKAEIHR